MAKNSVQLVEVGLRDGLQNEMQPLAVKERIEFAEKLIEAGLRRIELGAFVREDRVPQMAGSEQITTNILQKYGRKIKGSVLVPNEIGMLAALQTPVKDVAVFASCSESFSRKNINCSIEESFSRFENIFRLAKKNRIKVRGYLSTCFACPYEGNVSSKKVVELARRLYKMGCYEISIGDTIGVATPGEVKKLFKQLKKVIPVKNLAGHFHDTRGMAVANIYAAFQEGVRVFDTSLGGLGGCPYAPGSAGNVATEDAVYLLDGLGVKTGISIEKLVEIHHWAEEKMKKELPSRVGRIGRLNPLGKVSGPAIAL